MAVGTVKSGGSDYASLLARLKNGESKAPSATVGATDRGVQDAVSLSSAAQKALNAGAGGEILLKAEGDDPGFDFEKMQRETDLRMAYRLQERDFWQRASGAARDGFGFSDGRGAVAISGSGVIDFMKRRLTAEGAGPPEKSAELKAIEARDAENEEPAPSAATARTSVITLFLPGSDGTGSKQIEIFLDNEKLDKLASMSADDVKNGLMNLKDDSDGAKTADKAVKDGVFGDYMRENAKGHPEFDHTKERYALFDPEEGDGAPPMMMIQTASEPDYVRENLSQLADGVLNILRGGARPSV